MDNVVVTDLDYQTGFGNEFATEALAGALPKRGNSPQKAPHGLYAELLTGTAFTVARENNQRSWLYRARPSVVHKPFEPIDCGLLRGAPFDDQPIPPNQLRWDPLPMPEAPTDFVDGLVTMMGGGDAASGAGLAVHLYTANTSMTDRFFYNADGEMLFVPQQGRLILRTEMGVIDIAPNEIAVIQRGIKFQVEVPDGMSRGYVCENYGAALRLPSLGPIGSNGLANPRDFGTPVAAYEDREGDFTLTCKMGNNLWSAKIGHSPLDVVAWHGNYAPYKYDLADFNVIGSISYDHPDPSIFTVLTSPSNSPGTANIDFVIFPPRWMVAEDTYRPPWYHRNVMSEFMGLIHGEYDGRKEGFVPGGSSLHNCMVPHGNDAEVYEEASKVKLKPQYIKDTMAFMFETYLVYKPTKFALETELMQQDYADCWQGLKKHFQDK
ncbi:MAG: homogentisate 1,2-dioxygenase [Rhodospirillaceae bacterium]|jgi:homogentisate 1,2-dioxygenase|nr:homogentisate 1,2-dioxygenase [Rhodospirillaceae bacterium]MBT7955436.1 homogentisate 1,2-dioxygenase [Rhodospirillaceae bacterium]